LGQANSYHKAEKKSSLKIVAGGGGAPKPKQLRAGGLEPSESMAPGKYIANCEGATITTKGRSTVAVLEFRIIDGLHSGTALRQWITIPDIDGIVPLGSRYGRQCALALGRDIESGDDLNPATIFKGRLFRVDVGYRMTEKIGGIPSHEHTLRRKDHKDFLRVHNLIAVEELS
jgi:hypothetical protein